MRIIAGVYRGRQLASARDKSIRPTTDRAKQTIFDILSARMSWDGVRVLDLFSGTGSLGLEAISRGASLATFVENARSSLDVLEHNIRSLGCDDQCTAYQADVFWYLKTARQVFDVIFADPPYRLERIGEIPLRIHESSASRHGSWVVMEHSRESAVELRESDYEIIRKPFGQTTVLILRTVKPAAATDERTRP